MAQLNGERFDNLAPTFCHPCTLDWSEKVNVLSSL
ncbi:hypothetical protein LINGRAPRIM_LOCUS2377 [Linum grandiflorum]